MTIGEGAEHHAIFALDVELYLVLILIHSLSNSGKVEGHQLTEIGSFPSNKFVKLEDARNRFSS